MDRISAFSSLLALAHFISGRVMSCSSVRFCKHAAHQFYRTTQCKVGAEGGGGAETDREVLVRCVLGRVVVPEAPTSPAAPSSTASERHRETTPRGSRWRSKGRRGAREAIGERTASASAVRYEGLAAASGRPAAAAEAGLHKGPESPRTS